MKKSYYIKKFLHDEQWVYKVALIMFFSYEAYRFLVSSIITNLIGPNKIDTVLCLLVTLPFYLNATIKFLKGYIKLDIILIYTIILILFLGSVFFFPDNKDNLFEVLSRALPFIGGYFYIRVINDPKSIISSLKIIAIVFFVCYLPFPFLNGITSYGVLDEGLYMSYGYAMYYPAIIFLYYSLKERGKKRLFYFLLSFISVLGIVFWGNRGPILAYLGFVIIYLLFSERKKIMINSFFISGFFSLVAYLLTSNTVLINLLSFLSRLGFTSRTIELWLRNDITSSVGREQIQLIIIENLKRNDYIGFGVAGDRYVLGGRYAYAHNLFLELLVSFGPIITIIIVILMLYFTLNMFINCRSQNHKDLFIIFFSLSFFRLMLSSSFWYEPTFYASIAIIVSYYKGRGIGSKWGVLVSNKSKPV